MLRGNRSNCLNAPTRATTIAEEEPRPDPGGASVCMNRSNPAGAPMTLMAAFTRSSWPSYTRSAVDR